VRRRDFLKLAAGALGALSAAGCSRPAQQQGQAPTTGPTAGPPAAPGGGLAGKVGKNRHDPHPVEGLDAVLARSTEPAKALEDADAVLRAALEPFGGIEAFVQRGDNVVIKPNLAWARMPEQAANTHPAVLAAVVRACRDAGAGEVLVIEHPCDRSVVTFDMSGAQAACREIKVPLVSLDNEQLYGQVPVAKGVNITDEQVPLDLLDADVYINLPVGKVHGASVVTLGMKNQLGAVWRPQRYHESKSEEQGDDNLHQNIADLATALRPTLNIVDCAQVLLTNGPKGPGRVEAPGALVVSPDIVAVDAAVCELLSVSPDEVGHIRLAADAGLGRMRELQVKRVQV